VNLEERHLNKDREREDYCSKEDSEAAEEQKKSS